MLSLIKKVFAQDESIIGKITLPEWVEKHGSTEVDANFGLIKFLNNILLLLVLIAGLYGFFNLINAGLDYIYSSGDPEKIKKANSKITNSLLGLVIIAISFTLAAIMGWLLFGDATIILKPKITGVGT